MPNGINPGDTVVALAAAAQTAGLLSGGLAGAISFWIARHKPMLSVAGFIGGALVGLIVGMLVGRLLFPASGGSVVIVKAGPSSLASVLKGNLTAGIAAGLVVSALSVLLMKADYRAAIPASLAASVLAGIATALLASLS